MFPHVELTTVCEKKVNALCSESKITECLVINEVDTVARALDDAPQRKKKKCHKRLESTLYWSNDFCIISCVCQ